MAKQTFTTGQVLTAAQMTSLQQTAMGGGAASTKTSSYTLVAADAGTTIQMNSASSTTITVNTSLFAAGDVVFIQNIGAGVCTITAGTATVTTAGSLALSQWEGGQLYFTSASASIFFDYIQTSSAAALTKISTTTLSSSYADISNIFSATYDRYLIVMEITAASDSIKFQLQNSGTRSTSGYNGAVSGYRYNATAYDASQSAAGDGYLLQLGTATSPGTNGMVEAIIVNPFAAATTRISGTFTGVWNAGSFWTNGTFGITHNVATSYNGISILPVSGNMTGTFTVYGMS